MGLVMDNLSVVNTGQHVDCVPPWRGQTVHMGRRSKKTNGIDPKVVGPRLIAARLALKIEQSAALADALGEDRSAWLKYEKGERIIPARIASDFAERYGIPMDYVYRGRTETILDQELRSRIIDALRSL